MAIKVNKVPENGYKYTPQSEISEKEPFSVWIRPLPINVLLDLEDNMVQRQDDKVIIAQGLFSFKVLQQGLINWENMTDGEGKELKFEAGFDSIATEDSVLHIPADMITEIANVITAITRDPATISIFFPKD